MHPDETERCVELYISSMATAGLVTVEGDRTTHVASTDDLAVPLATRTSANLELKATTDEESSEFEETDTDRDTVADVTTGGTSETRPCGPI